MKKILVRKAVAVAIEAGADGVEIHGAKKIIAYITKNYRGYKKGFRQIALFGLLLSKRLTDIKLHIITKFNLFTCTNDEKITL